MMRRLACLVLVVPLLGCGHNLYFTARQSGATGQASITTTPGHPSGTMTVAIGRKTVTGRWLYMSGAGTVAAGTATATSGLRSSTATGTAVGMPMSGNGSILLSSPEGDTMRCVFNYSEWSSTGLGECQDNHGEDYDLQIAR